MSIILLFSLTNFILFDFIAFDELNMKSYLKYWTQLLLNVYITQNNNFQFPLILHIISMMRFL